MKKTFAVFVWILLVSTNNVIADNKEPDFIIRESIWNLEQLGTFSDYRRFLIDQGYSGVDLDILDDEGNYYFFSPSLEQTYWNSNTDLLSDVLREMAHLKKKRKSNDFILSLNITGLAKRMRTAGRFFTRRAQSLSEQEMAEFVQDLQHNYTFSDFTSEPFRINYQQVLRLGASRELHNVNMLVLNPYYEQYLNSSASYSKEIAITPDRFITYDVALYPEDPESSLLPTVGLGDVAFAIGRTYNGVVWASCETGLGLPDHNEHNILLYRAIQYKPEGYVLRPNPLRRYIYNKKLFSLKKNIKKDILRFTKNRDDKIKKPVANLVLSSNSDSKYTLPQYIEPITNALLANGYEIRVSFDSFLDKVDLYYVVHDEEWQEDSDFFEKLLDLLDYKTSRFFGKVILHPLGLIRESGPWEKIRENFKIPHTEKGSLKSIPATLKYNGEDIRWKGNLPGINPQMAFLRSRKIHDNHGQVLLSALFENETHALILKTGDHYLVNGNFLHFEASFILSFLVGGALQSPSLAYVTSGRYRTAALAFADTEVSVKIPTPEIPNKWRVIQYNVQGNEVYNKVEPAKEVFNINIKAHELAIVLPQ